MRLDLADEFAEILGFSEISVDRAGTVKGDLVERRQRLYHQFAHHVADPRCNTSIATMIRNQVPAASLSPPSFGFRIMSRAFVTAWSPPRSSWTWAARKISRFETVMIKPSPAFAGDEARRNLPGRGLRVRCGG